MEGKELIFFVITVSVVFVFMAVFFVVLIYKNYQSKVLRDKEILDAIYKTQDEERNRIAVDLHDDIGLGLNAIRFHTQAILQETSREDIEESVKDNVGAIDGLVLRIREIVRAQSTAFVSSNGMVAELLNLYGRNCEKRNIQFNHDINLNGILLDKPFQLNHFRICQELLNNALKHAHCTHIDVKLIVDSNSLMFAYNDNGKGVQIAESNINGIGIQNIKSRAEMYSGKIKFDSTPGNGFGCVITYPLKNIKEVL